MIPLDLSGKVALVTGVGDNVGFAWHIAKYLQAAGARLIFAVHPRLVSIVESILTRDADAESRVLPYGTGSIEVEKVFACDVSFDTMADVDAKTREDKRFTKHGDFSIAGLVENVKAHTPHVDIVIHAVAFSPEIKNRMVETSRSAYLTALSISSYSLTALMRAFTPLMEGRPDPNAVALTYLGGDRVVPHYGGGMSTAKAALQIDAQQLASNLGTKKIRVNLVSAGPYASRAARAIGDINDMINHAAVKSPLPRPIEVEEVANATAFLCSPLASAVTAQILYVDCGYNVMGV